MTAPFSDALNAALRQSDQGGIVDLYGGLRVFPQYHCCVSGNTVGVYKDPVAMLEVADQSVCEYDPVTVSFDKSFSTSSTIITWSLDWGDGNVSNGAWPPPASVSHPAGGYAFASVYTITLTITDLLGAFDMDAQEVNVMYCPMIPPVLPGIVVGAYTFGSCYTDDLYAFPVVWQDMQSAQLNVPGAKKIWGLKFVQNHNNDKWHVFAATECGIWRYDYLPAGTGSWNYVVSHADLSNLGGIPFGSTVVWEVDCSLDNPGRVVGFFGGKDPWPWQAFGCVVSSDYFNTIDRVVWIKIEWLAGNWKSGGRIVQGLGGDTMYAGTYDNVAGSVWYKSTNAGAAWTPTLTPAGSNEHTCHTPYVSEINKGKRVYALNNTAKHTTINSGTSWATMGADATRPVMARGSPYILDEMEFVSASTLHRWEGGVYTQLRNWGAPVWSWDFLPIARDGDQHLIEALLVGDDIGGSGWIKLWTPTSFTDRRGNWAAVTGDVQTRAVATVNYGWPRGV